MFFTYYGKQFFFFFILLINSEKFLNLSFTISFLELFFSIAISVNLSKNFFPASRSPTFFSLILSVIFRTASCLLSSIKKPLTNFSILCMNPVLLSPESILCKRFLIQKKYIQFLNILLLYFQYYEPHQLPGSHMLQGRHFQR